MSSPAPGQFEAFYEAVHGKAPFPWQSRLATRVCGGDWPRAIALPTAAGKTACIDVAVFALACAKDIRQPRRIFFVVDRRIVVDQAFDHAKKLAKVLHDAKEGILKQVADALRALAGEDDARPLDVYALRGGMYRESAWARSPLQPTVIASTVDQVGSRLLFRGYGVSDSMKPVHAGLVGNDALILLDEAHCAKPFDQTMQAVESYRGWGEGNDAPFRFVSVTATPTGELPEAQIERDDDADRAHPVLGRRISASKPAALVVAEKAKGKSFKQWGKPLVEKLADEARKLSAPDGCVGIIVNRVATARALAKELGNDAVLLTGRMRPLDRDRIFEERLRPLLSDYKGEQKPPKFVVGTQCLECGADFDFHALVTECASLDALRQRFGRLNRIAARPSAKAVVVVRADQTEPAEKEGDRDPVYDNALANTWKWLNSKAPNGEFDFGVSAVREHLRGVPEEELAKLNAPSVDAPVLFPGHLDCWVQTHPIPTPDPDPALFLHGPKQTGQPDVQVVFRADLGADSNAWAGIVGLCPPSSSEAVAVPIGVFKKWLADELVADETADVEGGAPEEADEENAGPQPRHALRWRGPEEGDSKTKAVSAPKDVTPNDTYVVPCSAPGIDGLGDFPPGPVEDFAAEAFQRSRDKALLWLPGVAIPEDADKREEAELIAAAIDGLLASSSADAPAWRARAVAYFADAKNLKRREVARHPLGGVVVTGTGRLRQFDPTYLDDSEPGESFRGGAVTLEEHSRGVAEHARRFAAGCGLDADLYAQAGLWHDLGKLDPRFQAMLRQSSPRTAVGAPLAKSGKASGTPQEREQLRQVHRYPRGARHELLSAALVAGKHSTGGADDLLLHLIATHHGSARPFADAVAENDEVREPFKAALFETPFELKSSAQQIREWNAELPERFWRVVRKWGWWGGAYREAVFRLADHAQSAADQDRVAVPAPVATGWVSLPAKAARADGHALPLTGLDGANPLAFLAALGTLRCLATCSRGANRPAWLDGPVRLSWGQPGIPSVAVLHLPGAPSPDELTEFLAAQLAVPLPHRSARESVAREVIDSLPLRLEELLKALEPDQRRKALEIIADVITASAEADVADLARYRGLPEEIKKALTKQLAEACPKSDLAKKGPGRIKELLGTRFDRDLYDHPASLAVALTEGEEAARYRFIDLRRGIVAGSPDAAGWAIAHHSDLAPDGRSQLLIVRADYLRGNILNVFERTTAPHLLRALFATWDHADGLDNQSLHWEPSEDRRHAYQWHQPNGDPTKAERGGMLGANRLALEAWPLFPSFPDGDRVRTRGFRGNRAASTFWLWPLWSSCLTVDGAASMLSLPGLQAESVEADSLRGFGVMSVFRSQRILVGKTPNLTPPERVI